ncbi:hypothetical protein AGLY_010959 [Aphis glycines]|uniref:Uncharacterized protein n=1 Tax=Aphis glycines TaxID=307491 RepID=A0A6G0TEA9_APHGL|nr:hypothetical protein AGLY_010959 [Aphis glycines]
MSGVMVVSKGIPSAPTLKYRNRISGTTYGPGGRAFWLIIGKSSTKSVELLPDRFKSSCKKNQRTAVNYSSIMLIETFGENLKIKIYKNYLTYGKDKLNLAVGEIFVKSRSAIAVCHLSEKRRKRNIYLSVIIVYYCLYNDILRVNTKENHYDTDDDQSDILLTSIHDMHFYEIGLSPPDTAEQAIVILPRACRRDSDSNSYYCPRSGTKFRQGSTDRLSNQYKENMK